MVRELALLVRATVCRRAPSCVCARLHVAQLMSLDSLVAETTVTHTLHAYNLHLRCLAAASASAAAETILILMALKKLSASEDASEPVGVRRRC